jgi:aldehyde:ferredoxin oxidoreductase
LIGFTFEAVERGLIEPPDEVKLTFGSVAGAECLIHAMAMQTSDLGRLLR